MSISSFRKFPALSARDKDDTDAELGRLSVNGPEVFLAESQV
jgi:hypothetical protein